MRSRSGRWVRAAALLLAAAWVARPAAGQGMAADSGSFVVRMGTDTLAVERYVRRGSRVEGEMVVRDPRTSHRSYTAVLRPDGSVASFAVRLRTLALPNGGDPYTFAYDFGADSARAVFSRPAEGVREEKRIATGGAALPQLRYSQGLNEVALGYARRSGVSTVALLPVSWDEMLPMAVRGGGDAWTLDTGEGPNAVRVDASGRILRFDGTRTLTKVTAERVATVDVGALAADFARRDREGRGVGSLSPRDSVHAVFGGAGVSVGYGRPSMRGRKIFGGILPYGQVWRTGANITTQLHAGRDLVIGGTRIPAGTYSLYTLPEADRWTLILNRAYGASGREDTYDPARDVARIPMRFRALDAPVETLSIRLEPDGEGGVLRIAWETTEAWVPISVP